MNVHIRRRRFAFVFNTEFSAYWHLSSEHGAIIIHVPFIYIRIGRYSK